MNKLPALVLAAEDEETDAFILRRAFKKAGISNPLIIARDGQEVLDYLTGVPPFDDRVAHPLPVLVTLDLKMPRRNGFDVLAWLRSQSAFKDLPAVVISSSSDEQDVEKAHQLGAQDYFVKPHSIDDFVELVRALHRRWLAGDATPPR